MKKILLYTVVALLFSGSAFVSCTGDFEEYNKNPETPAKGETAPITLLENLIYSGAKELQHRSWQCHSELMQYTVDIGNSTRYHVYTFPASIYESLWKNFFGFASNAEEIVQLARKYDEPNMEAIGLTLKAMYFSIISDMYGDIPFTEALRIDEGITQPKMDRQKDIYEALIQMLLDANALYNTTKDGDGAYAEPLLVPAKDLLYGGDIAAWQKFTNSLNLRLCLRLSNRPEAIGLETLRKIVESPGVYPIFGSVADDAKIAYTGVAPFRGPFGGMTDGAFTSSSHKCSERFVDQIYSTYDPRRLRWTRQSGDDIKGVQSGYKNPDGNSAVILNVSVLKPYEAPAWYMTASEVKFILAEAAHAGYIGGGETAAQNYYEEAVIASLRQWIPEISAADIDKFIHGADSKVAYDGTLERIIDQKWVSLFMQGFESWCDYRRTGFPRLVLGPDAANANGGMMPTRMLYGQTTTSTNRPNYEAVVAYMRDTYPVVSMGATGGDNMMTPVWWSKRAVELNPGQ